MDCSRTNESNYKFSHPMNHKVDGESSFKDRSPQRNSIPISVRYKKLGNDEASRQRDHHRKERLQQTLREPPSIEFGPKRLKVRGLSFLSL